MQNSPEDDVEEILDADPAGDAAERIGGAAEILGAELGREGGDASARSSAS